MHPIYVADQVFALGKRDVRARRALVRVFSVGWRRGGCFIVGRSGRLAWWCTVQAQDMPVTVRLRRER